MGKWQRGSFFYIRKYFYVDIRGKLWYTSPMGKAVTKGNEKAFRHCPTESEGEVR